MKGGTRRRFLVAAGGALLGASFVARAQRPARDFKVGVLAIGASAARAATWQPFADALRELGYVEGRNLTIRYAFGEGDFDRLPGFVTELVAARVDVIVTTGTREIAALKEATSSIPIVMTLAANPVAEGFVASLARPGGNITGFTSLVPGLAQKYIELMLELFPQAKRLGVLGMPPNPNPVIRGELEEAARARGITLTVLQPAAAAAFEPVLGRAKKDGVSGIIVPLDGGSSRFRNELAAAMAKHGLPGIYWDRAYVEAGGLMTYSAVFADILRRAAGVADKIFRGTAPGDIPVEQPTRFELVINLRTARALGLTLPTSMRVRADHVIE